MMKLKLLALMAVLTFSSFSSKPEEVNMKCLVQLTNYSGEGAYVAVSLLDASGKYQKTLYVFGKEKRWYDDLTSWFRFYSAKQESVDAISGASITPGSRKVFSFSLDDTYYNKGYKLRFETAVENQEYKEKDLEVDFSSANVGKSLNGTGYIRYVKLIGS
ncbi:DUF2271 domain-containing protein [Jiulongibacter sp. NS-SX5]|uniref:DUF2271 domain-containing protein n=1 Tax=Jiulongibacter sp. NS-SX5 TaxID=3463854 RepID=UPI00405812F0